jgi:hemerythrin
MREISTFAQKIVDEAAHLNGHTSKDWAVLASVKHMTSTWAPDMAALFAEAMAIPGVASLMEKYSHSDREQAIGVWYERVVSGAPGASFWAETSLIGFYHASAGTGNDHVLAYMSKMDSVFLNKCIRTMQGPKAIEVYGAFKRIIDIAQALMIASYETAIITGMSQLGFNDRLLNRMRTVAVRKMIDEARGNIPLMVWDDSLSVGVAEVDRQHKTLIDLLNALHDGKNQGRGSDVLGGALAKLATYTVEHFAYEEKVLTQHGYPELPGHIESHEKLKARVVEFKTAFDEGRSSLGVELFMFLRSWLNGHIRGSDRAYGKFLNAKGVR